MSAFAHSVLGEYPVHPGHPLTTAAVIMHRYATLAEAEAETSFGWPDALGNGDINGCGGEVYSALRLLKDIQTGVWPLDEAPDVARSRWEFSEAGGYTDYVVPGQEQADRLRDLFLVKAREWFTPVPAPSV